MVSCKSYFSSTAVSRVNGVTLFTGLFGLDLVGEFPDSSLFAFPSSFI